MRRLLNLVGLFGTILVLLVFMLWLRNFDFGAATSEFHPKSLAATGFIILAAFSMGEFFKILNIPALLGYLAAGVLFGPELASMLPGHPEALFGSSVITDLSLVNVLTIGVIGTMGGGELKISEIKMNITTIIAVVALILVFAVVPTFVAVLLVVDHLPTLAPFLQGMPREHVWAAALLFGVFAVAMSPAATLAILQETRAHGRFASLVLGVVVVADLVLVALFLLVLQFDLILLSPEGFSLDRLLAALPAIGAEFGYALLIGIVTGLVFILYLRFVKKEHLFFTVAAIFATAYVSKMLHAETLLAFLTAGFIVQNFSKQGHDMIHALEKISLPVFVIYFMTQAAQLDLQAVSGYLWLTAILAGVRGVALYLGSGLATAWLGAEPTTRRYLWLAFFSRGGVDLVLAAAVAETIAPWGGEFQTVIMAVVVVHIVAGPPILKLALDWAGDTEGSRRKTAEEAEAFEALLTTEEAFSVDDSFPLPHFPDPALRRRMTELRDVFVGLHRQFIAEPLRAKADAMRRSLEDHADGLEASLQRLEAVLDSDDFRSPETMAAAVSKAHVDYLNDIEQNVAVWESVNPQIVRRDRLVELIDAVRNRVEFSVTVRVEAEPGVFESSEDDPAAMRLLKALRRARRALFGPGIRTIPLGRLWRFYVELTLTRYLASAASATAALNEAMWADLGNHLRRVDDLFDSIYDAVLESPPDDEDADPDALWGVTRARAVLEDGRIGVEARERALREKLAACARTAADRYTVSLRETYVGFLRGVERAGTAELPGWAYRPSALFDRSRRAEAQMAARLRRERTIVTGQQGWIVAEYQLVLFLYWLQRYEDEVALLMDDLIAKPTTLQLEVLADACRTVPPELGESLEAADEAIAQDRIPDVAIDWDAWLHETINPEIRHTRALLRRLRVVYADGAAVRSALTLLEKRIGEFSELVVLLSKHPDQIAPDEVVPTLRVPLREWFVSEVVREAALRFVEFNERGEAAIGQAIAALEDVQHVVEYNLLTAASVASEGDRKHAVEIAVGGLLRAVRLVEECSEHQRLANSRSEEWLVAETNAIGERAADPFLAQKLPELEGILARRGQATLAERGETFLVSRLNRTISLAQGLKERYAPVLGEVVEEVQSLFVEEDEKLDNTELRRLLLGSGSDSDLAVPPIYRRLFTPVPLDIPDFYIHRPEAEDAAVSAVVDWAAGNRNAVLLFGDRGSGKRSTAHHVFQARSEALVALGTTPVKSVTLDDDVVTEAEVATRLAAAFGSKADTIVAVERVVELYENRQVVIVENGEKLFTRTDEGLERCMRFLRLLDATQDKVLWVVLMGTAAVTYLDTALGLRDFFTHSLELKPLAPEEIEQMVQRRHRVSGFQTSFEREKPRIRDWLRRPVSTSNALRDPRAEYFRDLARLCDGNPMDALMQWLQSVAVDEEDEHLIVVHTLSDTAERVMTSLTLDKQLILAALVQHRSLTVQQLHGISRRPVADLRLDIEHLIRLGFVSQAPSRQLACYRIRRFAAARVTADLRAMNLI